MERLSVLVFELLERAWSRLDCTLVDMKVEFGVTPSGDVVLADVVDNDAWRVWPSGDPRLMKDKQVYRNLKEVTADGLATVLKNYEWVMDKVATFCDQPPARVIVATAPAAAGGASETAEAVMAALEQLGMGASVAPLSLDHAKVCTAHPRRQAHPASAGGHGVRAHASAHLCMLPRRTSPSRWRRWQRSTQARSPP